MGLLFSAATACCFADDGMKPARPARQPITMKDTVTLKESPVIREVEIRLGPRFSFLTGDVRAGLNGTRFDIWDDLGLDEPSGGAQFHVDWQVVDRLHLDFDLAWDHYDHSGRTKRDISNGGAGAGRGLVSGSSVNADLNFYSFEGSIGYDVIRNDSFRLKPYIGGKGYLVDGSFTTTNNGPGGSGVARTTSGSQAEGTYLVGVDGRWYTTPRLYLGGDIGASVMSTYHLLTGEAYTGYDFSKDFGLRLGYAYDYLAYKNRGKTTSADPLLGAVYLQAVWGF